jgi:hypothetical protein
MLIADFGIDWRTPKSSLQRDPVLRSWLDALIQIVRVNPSTTIRVIGYSDCGGGERNNYLLRRGRADRVLRLLQQLAGPHWPVLRSKITSVAAPQGQYIADNATIEGRAKNRGVLIEHFRDVTMEPERVTARPAAGQCRFLPSQHGFRFPNSFTLPSALKNVLNQLGLNVGSGSYGLCGGMAFLAADMFIFGVPRPTTSTVPPIGSTLYLKLLRRLLDSWQIKLRTPIVAPLWIPIPIPGPGFAAPVWKFWKWMGLADRGPGSIAEHTAAEIAGINSSLTRGNFVVLGLVLVDRSGSLDDNHQVLAYCMRRTAPGTFVYAVYDPNEEMRDDIRIEVQLVGREARVSQLVPSRSGPPAPTPIRGIFKMPYSPKRP